MSDPIRARLDRTDPPGMRCRAADALRAVLDLHPRQSDDLRTYCGGCSYTYPCPTVRVIAERLGVTDV